MFQPQAYTAPVEVNARPWYKPAATGTALDMTGVSRLKAALPAPNAGATARPSNTKTGTSAHAIARKKPPRAIHTRKLERSPPGRSIARK